MQYKWLRSFHFVAREGGFTAASHVLNVGQSTVTAQVRALEERFNVELFYRKARTVSLTSTGRRLYDITQDIFGHYNEAEQLLSAAKEYRAGYLRIGAVGPPIGIQLAEKFSRRFPEVEFSVTVGNGEWMIRSLLEFQTDVAVLARIADDRRFYSLPYKRFEVIAFVNNRHPWADRSVVDIKELAGQKLILREETSTTRQAVERALRMTGVQLGQFLEINSREAVREAVLRGLGVGMVSEIEYVPDGRLRPIRVEKSELFIEFHVACLTSRKNRPLIAEFLEIADQLSVTCP